MYFFCSFQVTEAGKDTLPSWLHYSSDGSTLEGVPQQQDVGQHYIEVQAVAPHSTQPMKDVFSVNVVEDTPSAAVPLKLTSKNSVQPIKCPQGSTVTTVTVIVDAELNNLLPKEKVQLLERLTSHLNVASELLKLLPVGNKPMFDSQALVAGPGNVKQPQHDGALVQWEVGCGNVNAKHMPILQQVEATSQDGSMAEAIKHPIIGWHVTNNAPHIGRRMKRQINRFQTAVPTAVPSAGPPTKLATRTVVIAETDEAGEPRTRTVPTMGTPSFTDIKPTGTHKHHHHRTKSSGHHHHKSRHPHPKHSPSHKGHKTKHPKPTATGDIRPTPTGAVMSSTRTVDVVVMPTSGHVMPEMSRTIRVEPSIGIHPSRPTDRPTDGLPTDTRHHMTSTDAGKIRPTATDDGGAPTELFNREPVVKHQIDPIIAHVGEELNFRIPHHTFHDHEDGNTRHLKLVLVDMNGLTIPRTSWIKFKADTQRITGKPAKSDKGRQDYQLAAIDSYGKIARTTVEIIVRRARSGHKTPPTRPPVPPSVTDDMFNYPPSVKNGIDRIVVHVGEVLNHQVPEDTFFDTEDGNTRNLKLLFQGLDGISLPPISWIKFDMDTQTLIGLPMKEDVGRKEYFLTAIDKQGKMGRDAFEVIVRHTQKQHKVTHEFSATLDFDYNKFMASVEARIDVANKISKALGDPDSSNLMVTRIAKGSVIYAWTNSSMSSETCPTRAIAATWSRIVTANNTLNQTFVDAIKPYKIEKVGVAPKGSCSKDDFAAKTADKPIPPEPETIETRETSEDDVLITTVVPTVVIAAMLLIAGCIACFLYRRKRKGKLSDEDQHTFVNKGIPVIFADEMDDKPDPPTKPLILDEEKPPLPPPEYPRSCSGSAPSTPTSDHKEPIGTTDEEHEDDADFNSPLYQPPPPFTQTGNTRSPRPHVQPAYRQPPPYVPP